MDGYDLYLTLSSSELSHYLQGKVADVTTREAAEDIARQQLGVTTVDNELVVPQETVAG